MSKSNTTELDFLQYVFNATAFSWDASTILYIALHTADPWSVTLEGTYTAGEMLKLLTAVAAGKSDIVKLGNGLATITFRDINDTENRVIASMTNSERTAVILNP